MLTHRAATILGDIPHGWEPAPVHTLLAEHQSGDWGSDDGECAINIIRATNFTEDGILDLTDVAVRRFGNGMATKLALRRGDILLERSGGGPTQPVGRVGYIDSDMAGFGFTNFVQRLRPDHVKVNPCYLAWVLLAINQSGVAERLQHQTTQMRNLHFRDYLTVRVPYPPRSEQDAISDCLRAVTDSVFRTRDHLLASERLRMALMQQLLSRGVPGRHSRFRTVKHGTIPETWGLVRLKEVAAIGSGVTLNQDRAPRHNPHRYLTVVNVQRDQIVLDEERYLELWEGEVPARLLVERDLLVVEGHADSGEIGRAAIVDARTAGMTYQNHLFRVRVTTQDAAPEFLLCVLNSERVRRHWAAICNTSSGLNTINRRQLRNLSIPKPSQNQQDDIVAAIQAAKDSIDAIDRKLHLLTDLKRSLLQHLVTGKVRINAGVAI